MGVHEALRIALPGLQVPHPSSQPQALLSPANHSGKPDERTRQNHMIFTPEKTLNLPLVRDLVQLWSVFGPCLWSVFRPSFVRFFLSLVRVFPSLVRLFRLWSVFFPSLVRHNLVPI